MPDDAHPPHEEQPTGLTWIAIQRPVSVVVGVMLVQLPTGITLRYAESTAQELPLLLTSIYRQVANDIEPLEPGVIAGEEIVAESLAIRDGLTLLTGYAATLSSHIDNRSWNERIALNSYLLGMTTEEFRQDQKARMQRLYWGPWPREPDGKRKLLEERLNIFRDIVAGPQFYLKMYNVRYVAMQKSGSYQVQVLPALAQ